MSLKIGGAPNFPGLIDQLSARAETLPLRPANYDGPDIYPGGRLPVTIKPGDSQQTFVHRGLYEHAIKAGLDKTEAKGFADKWTNKNTTFNHRAGGSSSTPYTKDEFDRLKETKTAPFDLTAEFDAEILADLNSRVEYNNQFKGESVPAYTPEERAAMLGQQKGASVNQTAIADKPDVLLTSGKTRDGQPLTTDVALGRYIEKNYNQNGRVWGDKINQMVGQAKTDGVKVELRFNEDGTAAVGINAADKQKLDRLFNQALGETITGEQASAEGQREGTRMVADVPITLANSVTKAVEGVLNIPSFVEDLARAEIESRMTIAGVRQLPGVGAQIPKISDVLPKVMPEADLSALQIPNQSDLFNKDITGKVNPDGQTLGKTASTVTSMVIPIPLANGKTLRAAGDVADAVMRGGANTARKVEQFGQEAAAGMRGFGQPEFVTANGAPTTVISTADDALKAKGSNVQEARLPDMDEQINNVPNRERWRDLYGEGAETDAMNTVNKTGAGMAAKPQHHVFPREHRKFFEERGFTGERSIDKFVVTMDESAHQAIHGGADWKLARKVWKEGEWNNKVVTTLKDQEKVLGRKLTFEEVKTEVEFLMKEANIPQNYESWRGGVK